MVETKYTQIVKKEIPTADGPKNLVLLCAVAGEQADHYDKNPCDPIYALVVLENNKMQINPSKAVDAYDISYNPGPKTKRMTITPHCMGSLGLDALLAIHSKIDSVDDFFYVERFIIRYVG
ncbi:hypothetical protein ACFL3V_01905 [Nanoarchaeota archaeon]